jgi:hypothetical protein
MNRSGDVLRRESRLQASVGPRKLLSSGNPGRIGFTKESRKLSQVEAFQIKSWHGRYR